MTPPDSELRPGFDDFDFSPGCIVNCQLPQPLGLTKKPKSISNHYEDGCDFETQEPNGLNDDWDMQREAGEPR